MAALVDNRATSARVEPDVADAKPRLHREHRVPLAPLAREQGRAELGDGSARGHIAAIAAGTPRRYSGGVRQSGGAEAGDASERR